MISSMLRVVLFLALTAQCVLADCTQGWVEYDGLCFGFSETYLDWFRAASTCEYYGGRLARIESETKHNWLVTQIKERNIGTETWVGGSKGLSGIWLWIPSYESFNAYSNWGPGEPNHPTTELCLTIRNDLDYKWNDQDCTWNFKFVCEKSLKAT